MEILVKKYYKFFDEKLENWTMIIFIIAILITAAWLFLNPDKSSFQYKTNFLEHSIKK